MGPGRLSRDLSVGIHVPTFAPAALEDAGAYGEYFRTCEAEGFDALWTEDRIFHPGPIADPLLMLAWAAAHTERMLLGTAVLVLNLRRAPVAARQIATLDHLCGGRLAVGVSLGGRPEEYAALGVPMDRRVAVFNESVEVLRRLLRGEPVDHEGDLFRLAGTAVRPAADVPLLVGGVAEGALRRAGRLADGWIMAPFGSLEDFAAGWTTVREAAEAAGRDPDRLVAGRLLYVAVDDDRDRARRRLETFLHAYFGDWFDVGRHAIFGPPSEVTARLREQVEAGITHLMLAPPTLDLEPLRRLAREVAPALRAAR